jgi:hypothetical protein
MTSLSGKPTSQSELQSASASHPQSQLTIRGNSQLGANAQKIVQKIKISSSYGNK